MSRVENGTENGSLRTVLICGGGLAGWMTAARLAHGLPSDFEITVLELPNANSHDMFYGSVLSPLSYAFNLAAGVSEPDLFLETNTVFSWGTHYLNWGMKSKSWVQCFHLALPVLEKTQFTHIIAQRQEEGLESYLISAQAVLHGSFAHPPQDSRNPLSRAEYGYQFSPSELTKVFKTAACCKNVKTTRSELLEVMRNGSTIEAVNLSNGKIARADLFVDCTGPVTKLLASKSLEQKLARKISALSSEIANEKIGSASCQIQCGEYGWQSEASLRGVTRRLTVYHEKSEQEAIAVHRDPDAINREIVLGCKKEAWQGNCVAMGHAASAVEPITPAPIMLLQRDIDRLLRLIPLTKDMDLEASAYNKGFADDYKLADLFNQAFYTPPELPTAHFWTAASDVEPNDQLIRKLTQFESRGQFVTYDLEPFNEQDWAILHFGIGRRPRNNDPFAELVEPSVIEYKLQNLRQAINITVKKMPPHHIYVDKFVSYLKRKHGSNV